MCPSRRGRVLGWSPGWLVPDRKKLVWRLAPSAANPRIHEFTNSRIHESHPPRIQPLGDGCVCPPVVQLSSLLLLSSSLSSSLLASSKQQAIDARCPRLNPYPPPSSDCLGCSGWLLAAGCWLLTTGTGCAGPVLPLNIIYDPGLCVYIHSDNHQYAIPSRTNPTHHILDSLFEDCNPSR